MDVLNTNSPPGIVEPAKLSQTIDDKTLEAFVDVSFVKKSKLPTVPLPSAPWVFVILMTGEASATSNFAPGTVVPTPTF